MWGPVELPVGHGEAMGLAGTLPEQYGLFAAIRYANCSFTINLARDLFHRTNFHPNTIHNEKGVTQLNSRF